jgi:hypothetical protein
LEKKSWIPSLTVKKEPLLPVPPLPDEVAQKYLIAL